MKLKDYTEKDFYDKGYKKYKNDKTDSYHYIYQKMFYDDNGKRYSIEFYEYPEKIIGSHFLERSFVAQVAFQNTNPYIIIEYNHIKDFTLEHIESLFACHWEHIGRPYYEHYDNKN